MINGGNELLNYTSNGIRNIDNTAFDNINNTKSRL